MPTYGKTTSRRKEITYADDVSLLTKYLLEAVLLLFGSRCPSPESLMQL